MTVKCRRMWMGILLAVLCGGCPLSAGAITGNDVIARMQKKFAGYKTFSAKFEKQFYWALLDNKMQSRKGKIYTRRPNQFRLELENGDIVIAEGEAIWAYNKKNQQVVVSAYAGELKTPWEILLDYTESYAPIAVEEVKLEGRPCYMLSLRSRTQGSYVEQMKIWVDNKRWQLLKAEQREVNDNITTYILKDHRTNKKLDDALFRFELPEGVDVIDRRDQALRDE